MHIYKYVLDVCLRICLGTEPGWNQDCTCVGLTGYVASVLPTLNSHMDRGGDWIDTWQAKRNGGGQGPAVPVKETDSGASKPDQEV